MANWGTVQEGEPTKASTFNMVITNLNKEHNTDGTHKGSNYVNLIPLTNPHVMDTSPATTVSLVATGEDMAFRCGTTDNALVHWDYVELHNHINVAAGITMRVFWKVDVAPSTTVIMSARAFRHRQGAAAAQITAATATVLISATAGQCTLIKLDSGGLAAGDVIAPKLQRSATDGSDTFAGDFFLLAAQLEYTYQV